MANNYQESSTLIPIPAPLMHDAQAIAARIEQQMETEEDCFGIQVEFFPEGVLLYGEEYFNTSHAELLAKALVEELDLPDPVIVSWAYWCSRHRPDEFGGGAFAVRKGMDTVWVDALDEVRKKIAP